MAADDFNPDDLTEVLTVLRAAGIAADTDPHLVRAPGVWLRFDGLDLEHLHGLRVNTTLHVLTPETDDARVRAALAAAFNAVKATLRAAGFELEGPIGVVGVVLPGSSTAMPALACPLPLDTCQE